MLLLALLDMPGAYYQALRIVVCGVAVWEIVRIQAAEMTQGRQTAWTVAFCALAVAFNPAWPLRMDREEWLWFNLAGAAVFGVAMWGKTANVKLREWREKEKGLSKFEKQEREARRVSDFFFTYSCFTTFFVLMTITASFLLWPALTKEARAILDGLSMIAAIAFLPTIGWWIACFRNRFFPSDD